MDLVRGRRADEAIVELKFVTRRASPMISKVIRSAMANAQQEGGVETANLFVAQAFVDEGPTLKRWRPRAMGRAYPILKRTSHLTVVLEEGEEVVERPRRRSRAAPTDEASAAATAEVDFEVDVGAGEGESGPEPEDESREPAAKGDETGDETDDDETAVDDAEDAGDADAADDDDGGEATKKET